ncbi:long-chain fatty acid--CoA ligase [Desulfonema ishimotonii]|uniref:Long-chain fatty acid--CoA ligase n=1 Tax=Desulfonema ishimotonii TaxID=45657 RepID=A0A401FQE5_9BACT|nr:long-chain fatty acid--CoA ligase [Desulfonema ishimotonii]GBC59206.1 long-chain fatty acid--CoA ligase [Desulfonema ishimotonii]
MNQRHYPFWPKRLPKTLVYPRTPLFDLPETSARRYPDHTALVYYGNRISYARLWDEICRVAGALAACGVRKGDRVALYMQNCPHFIVSYFGIMRANAVTVPLNPMLTTSELARLLEDSGAKVVITTTELYDKVAELRELLGIRKVIVGAYTDYLPDEPTIPVPEFMARIPAEIEGTRTWAQVLAENHAPPEPDVQPDDLCLIPYTAGSTGIPKGCMHTHATVISNAISSCHWMDLTSATVGLAALPLFHVTGMINSFLAPFFAGSTVVLLTRWDRIAALEAIEKYRCNIWVNISTMVVDLLAAPGIEKRDLNSLSAVAGGGAPLPAAVGEKLEALTGLTYVEGYGLTETISQTHFNPPDRSRLGSIGVPDFGVDARIIDMESLTELPPGQEGELVISGPEVFRGYWNKPEETDEVFVTLAGKSFFRTGDICRMDEEGYFYIVDRSKRMINAAGFKVWPAEVESVLYRHPAVLEACVVGVPDPHRVENVKAFIVPRPEYRDRITAEEIIGWAKNEMSAYKYPRIIEFTDSLPKSGAGKIIWRELQAREKTSVAN